MSSDALVHLWISTVEQFAVCLTSKQKSALEVKVQAMYPDPSCLGGVREVREGSDE